MTPDQWWQAQYAKADEGTKATATRRLARRGIDLPDLDDWLPLNGQGCYQHVKHVEDGNDETS